MFLNQVTFQEAIENNAKAKRINFLESVIDYCNNNEIDPEDIAPLISSNLKDKIRQNAMDNGYMKKTAQLPI